MEFAMPHAKKSVIPSNPQLDAHAAEIIKLGRRGFADVVEIGRRLVLCRKLLKTQRCWLAWLRTKFGWSRTHADNLIGLYLNRAKLQKFCTLLPVSTLYTLAKQDPEVLQRVACRVEAGEPVTAQGVKAIVTIVDREIRSIGYDTTPPEVARPRPSDARIAADGFVARLTSLAQVVPGLDVAEVTAAVEHYEGADMAVRVMADFLHALSRRLGERAPLELLASDSETQH
jgi:hypothetical protein